VIENIGHAMNRTDDIAFKRHQFFSPFSLQDKQ